MAQNYVALVRNSGDKQAEVKLNNVPVTIGARGEKDAKGDGAKNEAIIADGNVKLDATGGRITAITGRPPTEDAETTKMKAKLLDAMPGLPPEKIENLVQELKDDFGAYRVDDLKEIDEEDLDKIKSVVGVAKKKFKNFIKGLSS